MKKFIIAAATLIVTAASANAGCGTNQLNGTWRLQGVDSASSQDFLVSNGNFGGVATITQNANCKVTIIAPGGTLIGRTENLKGTDRKPMTMMVSPTIPGADILVLFKM